MEEWCKDYIQDFDIEFDIDYDIGNVIFSMRPDTGGRIWPEKIFSRIDPERMFARHGGLRWYVLYLLSNGPKRGIDIMEEMEKRSWGYWRPSPGSIYPLLKSLEGEGLIRKNNDGYELTDEGKEVMGINKSQEHSEGRYSERIERAINDIESNLEYLEDAKGEISPYREKMKKLEERLAALNKSTGSE